MRMRGVRDGGGDGHELAFERVLFFSDAVFAIAITLLVIDLRLPDLGPHASNDDVIEALRAMAPRLFAYALSFATIGLYWLSHWRRYHHVVRVDSRLAGINLLLLGLVALIPFPTGLIGQYGDTPIAVAFYAVTLSAAGIMGSVSWLYADRAELTTPGLSPQFIQASAFRGLAVPIVMLPSLLFLPVIGAKGVELTWLLIIPVQVVARRWRGMDDRPDTVEEP
jgi:uncharacterized membrane protein